MNQYITGNTIKELREKQGLTQNELANKLGVTDKSVSKWETGKGYPDITLLEPIASVFQVSVAELLSGNTVKNTNISANLRLTKFYVCPVCGNVITSVGEAVVSCHGVELCPLVAEKCDGMHDIEIENIEGEYYVRSSHEMTKNHYISFISAVSGDKIQTAKLYPEGDCAVYFTRRLVKRIYFYCNRDGLFYKDI